VRSKPLRKKRNDDATSPELKDLRRVRWDVIFPRVQGRTYRFLRGQLIDRRHPAVIEHPEHFTVALVDHPWPPPKK